MHHIRGKSEDMFISNESKKYVQKKVVLALKSHHMLPHHALSWERIVSSTSC
jgi:hypothetical protein